jgi:hypothetical protein
MTRTLDQANQADQPEQGTIKIKIENDLFTPSSLLATKMPPTRPLTVTVPARKKPIRGTTPSIPPQKEPPARPRDYP